MSAQDWWAMKKYLDTQNRLNKYLLYELSPALSLETEFFFTFLMSELSWSDLFSVILEKLNSPTFS